MEKKIEKENETLTNITQSYGKEFIGTDPIQDSQLLFKEQ